LRVQRHVALDHDEGIAEADGLTMHGISLDHSDPGRRQWLNDADALRRERSGEEDFVRSSGLISSEEMRVSDDSVSLTSESPPCFKLFTLH
jgi:hypothetical protein